MILDFHTHTFPDAIAGRAIARLSASANIKSYSDGTIRGLKQKMSAASIDCAVLLPVATKPSQTEDINRLAVGTNDRFPETGILSFGGIHPDNEDYKKKLKCLAAKGVPGIKIHPVFQQTDIDDIRYMRIIEYACENGLIVLTHAGFDASFPGADFAAPYRILRVCRQIRPDKLVLAHMGGWDCWNEAEELLSGCGVYLDTAFSLDPLRPGAFLDDASEHTALSRDQFLRMVRAFGTDHILFGTDSPWTDMSEALELVRASGLTSSELDAILFENAAGLLKLTRSV